MTTSVACLPAPVQEQNCLQDKDFFDHDLWVRVLRSVGLPSRAVAVGLVFASCARAYEVSISQARLAIGSACSDVRDHVRALVEVGLLVKIRNHSPTTDAPSRYRLVLPETLPEVLAPPLEHVLAPGWKRAWTGQDAWRTSRGGLAPAFGVFTLLRSDTSISVEQLMAFTRSSERRVLGWIRLLVTARVATQDEHGVRLADGRVFRRLRAWARRSGLLGRRREAIEHYVEICAQRAEDKATYARTHRIVGTVAWVAKQVWLAKRAILRTAPEQDPGALLDEARARTEVLLASHAAWAA